MGAKMERQKPHKKLVLWGKVIDFVVFVYETTKVFPKEEEYGLKSQLRRAAVSVPSNISEGLSRRTKKDKIHFLNIAQASLSEIDAQIEVSQRLGFINQNIEAAANERMMIIEQMLSGLIRAVASR